MASKWLAPAEGNDEPLVWARKKLRLRRKSFGGLPTGGAFAWCAGCAEEEINRQGAKGMEKQD